MESILLEDNPHWNNLNAYDNFISRELLPKAVSYLTTKQILALIGARRVGKSTLAKLMIKELLNAPADLFGQAAGVIRTVLK